MQSLAIYHALLQTIPGDPTGGIAVPDQLPVNGWGIVALVVGAFGTGLGIFGKLVQPWVNRLVESRAKVNEAEAIKIQAEAKLALDVLNHQSERDKWQERMESRMDSLERYWSKTASKVDRNCGKHEPPDSDLIKKTKADK